MRSIIIRLLMTIALRLAGRDRGLLQAACGCHFDLRHPCYEHALVRRGSYWRG